MADDLKRLLEDLDPLGVLGGGDIIPDPEAEYSLAKAKESLRIISGIASSGERDEDNSEVERVVLSGYQDDLKSSQIAYARYQSWRRDKVLDLLSRVETRLMAPGRPMSNQDLLRMKDSLHKELNDSTTNIDRVVEGPPVLIDKRSVSVTINGGSKEARASRVAMLDLLQAIDSELSSIITVNSPISLPIEDAEVIEYDREEKD